MTLAAGTMLGPYRITGLVGEGGMGHVYAATDPRIGRGVAIKVLPRSLSADPDRLRRFEQEARAAGMLNHPNLLTIFELGTHEGAPFIVTELLEGETLRSRLRRGPVRVRQAVELAIAIASGLAAAHERGVVHRDLKPENIFITADERVKILDFGLAKLLPRETGPFDNTAEYDSGSATGTIVGTAGYMAPEQVRGHAVDHRADIFAFGAILYEMLSGERPFRKESPVETMNSILVDEPPPLPVIAPDLPASLERIVSRCMQKNREQRYQSARDLAFTLESFSTLTSSATMRARPAAGVSRNARNAAIVALTAALFFAAGYFVAWRVAARRVANPPVVRYVTFSGRDWAPAVSTDGRNITYVSSRDGTSRIWIKQLAGGSETALTRGPDLFPRFSPDGATILFTRLEGEATSLWRVPSVGGEPRRLVVGARDGDYSPDGRSIVFLRRTSGAPQDTWELWLASSDGSNARRIISTTERQLRSPRWSPDGSQIAVIAEGDQIVARILIVSVDGKTQRLVQPAQPRGVLSAAAWSSTRELIYMMSDVSSAQSRGAGAGGSVYAHDLRRGVRKLLSVPITGWYVDVAGARIVLDFNSSNQNLRESPLGGSGVESRWLTRGRSSDRQPVYSVDGNSIVFSSDRGGNLDLWSLSRKTSEIVRLTDDEADDWDPAFTPDGTQLLWSSNRSGHFEIWVARADGSDAHQLSHDGADAENPTATADGQFVVYTSFNPEKRGLWRMRRDGSDARRIVAGRCLNPEVSPDGQYVAYHSDEPFVSAALHVARVSDGALMPFGGNVRAPFGVSIGRTRWMPDGRAVAFIGADANGRIGIFTQDFDPARNLPETRRPLAGFDRDDPGESFGIAHDGSAVTISLVDQQRGVMVVDGALATR